MIEFTRHLDFIKDVNLHREIHVIGCGSIGTVVATTLVRMGFDRLHLWDADTVAAHNLANQYFEEDDLGRPKNEALRDKLLKINSRVLVALHGAFSAFDAFGDNVIILVCVDSMAARSLVWQHTPIQSLLVDGRMAGETGLVFAVNVNSQEAAGRYERTLYTDSEASELPCTARTIIYTVEVVGAFMSRMVLKLLTTKTAYQSFDIDLNTLRVEELETLTLKEPVMAP